MINYSGIDAMRKNIISCLLITTALTGCGGGSDSSPETIKPEVQTGVFTDSPVEGLYYETVSQSGFTNEKGEFNYLEGETITFSIGSTTLGITKAQEVITPFTLTGVKALKYQTEITNAFSGLSPNSFEKAINIATLLQGLDSDGNPLNGIDLGNAHERLSNLSIPLLTKSHSFTNSTEYSDARSIMQTVHSIDFISAAEHLYKNLGIEVESSLVANQQSNGSNAFSENIEFDYDSQNRLSTIRYDRNDDGSFETIQTFTYDEQGRLHTIHNSATNKTETLSYDSNNRLISRVTDGSNAISQNETFEYQNNQLSSFKSDNSSSGQSNFTASFQYDENYNLSGYELDLDGDTQADKTIVIQNNNGKVIRFTENTNTDKSIDIAYDYDASGNKVSQREQISDNRLNQAKFSYDPKGNLIRYELDNDLDGKADNIESYKYNQRNQRTHYMRDTNADGTWDFLAQYFYDVNGNRIKMIEDSDGNGLVDKTWEADLQTVTFESTWKEIAKNL
jgi:YD repeat-containing protein